MLKILLNTLNLRVTILFYDILQLSEAEKFVLKHQNWHATCALKRLQYTLIKWLKDTLQHLRTPHVPFKGSKLFQSFESNKNKHQCVIIFMISVNNKQIISYTLGEL